MIDNNVPVPEVSELLGHADQSFTFRRYVHSRKDATKKAAAAGEENKEKDNEEHTKETGK